MFPPVIARLLVFIATINVRLLIFKAGEMEKKIWKIIMSLNSSFRFFFFLVNTPRIWFIYKVLKKIWFWPFSPSIITFMKERYLEVFTILTDTTLVSLFFLIKTFSCFGTICSEKLYSLLLSTPLENQLVYMCDTMSGLYSVP